MRIAKEDRSIGELFSELSREIQDLLRQEVELAKIELSQKISRTIKDVAFLAVGAAVAYAAFLALVGTVILAIGTAVPLWVSALIVTLILGGVSYTLVQKGLNDLKRQDFKPRRTIETLKEDTRWMKRQM